MGFPLLSSIAEKISGPVGQIAGYGIVGAMTLSSYKSRVQEGQGKAHAFLAEAGMFGMSMILSGPANAALMFGLPAIRMGTLGVMSSVRRHNNYVRQMRTPFCHRFEHTDVTMRAQMAGLQAIGSSVAHGMGAEAAIMARRYGR